MRHDDRKWRRLWFMRHSPSAIGTRLVWLQARAARPEQHLPQGTTPGIFSKIPGQTNPEAMLIVNATSVVLKKKANTEWTRPTRRMARELKPMSAVCPEVPMMQAK